MRKYLITIAVLLYSIVVFGQASVGWSLRSGAGYFGDVGAKLFGSEGDFEGFNPRFYETYQGSAIFFEVSYLMENNYSVGVKLFKAETELPYNNIYLKNFIHDANSIAIHNAVEIYIAYNFSYKKHRLAIGCGPVLSMYKQSFFNGQIVDVLTDGGNEFGVLYLDKLMIDERSYLELGVNPNISYEFMLNKTIGIGFKTEAYLLAYYGLSYLTFYPTIVFRI